MTNRQARLISRTLIGLCWIVLIGIAIRPTIHNDLQVTIFAPAPAIEKSVTRSVTRPLRRGHAIVKTGVHSVADLYFIILTDPEAARHYAGFNLNNAYLTTLDHTVLAFVSYRVDGKGIFWSSRPELLQAGEEVLTDGVSFIRARCGNRIAFAPQLPVNTNEEITGELTPPESSLSVAPISNIPELHETRIETYSLPRTPAGPIGGGSGTPVAPASLPGDRTVVLIAVAAALGARLVSRRFNLTNSK